MNDLLQLQALRRGIKWTFTIDGRTITNEFRLFFPVLFLQAIPWNTTSYVLSGEATMVNFCADYVGQRDRIWIIHQQFHSPK